MYEIKVEMLPVETGALEAVAPKVGKWLQQILRKRLSIYVQMSIILGRVNAAESPGL